MIKRLAFVAGFGIGFVVGSASGRKSYESLRESAINTWNDPKVQAKVSEGTDWVKSEVPVVGEKIAEGAQKATETVTTKASEGAAAVKDKAQDGAASVKEKAQSSSSQGTDAKLPKPATTEKDVDMEPAHPAPDAKDMKN
ncbi:MULTISPECIES: hypothetical protein [Kocuria]|uniref:YtxH domain-containing protein n=1 Tax=Kocuria rhizophila (strain ATCC 9341 / DSM 348 / NBRC 103217 / DC2201) TaxID=378753 RepID=B2GJ54_KOCRD|nr:MULTISPECIES: hypothetical protein [Kocuria]ASE10378.1 hypothetical protein CEP81_01025 [Kocuria rhizophila]WTI32759.1 hypothetical protein OH817_02470 [Kocuria rhizophila]BAG29759.1 hypothetical protein KRH_14120 [Kocuria rhizophila DC2201]VEH74965.1 Uncharacterised protein [Kocuria rhizophila]